jgi:hypothetical protein
MVGCNYLCFGVLFCFVDKTKKRLIQQGLRAFPSKGYSRQDVIFVRDFARDPESGGAY